MKFNTTTIIAFILVVFSLFSIYRYYNEDNEELQAAIAASSEQYLTSDMGRTRYQVYGDEGNPVVILIHSFNGFIESWQPNIDALVASGLRVIAYDLWGRGLSSRPRVDMDLQVFRDQLDDLADHLKVDSFHLLGSSFGCVIASDYALNNAERVEKLVLIGPAGWPSESNSGSLILNIPIIGDAIFHYFGEEILKAKVEAYLLDKEAHGWVIDKWQRYASYPGFTRSALSTLRHSPLLDYTTGWKRLGKLGKPTLFIWGERDVSFPFTHAREAARLIPHAKIMGIKDAAHWVNIEKPGQVNEAVVSFLSR